VAKAFVQEPYERERAARALAALVDEKSTDVTIRRPPVLPMVSNKQE
jgi:hypothetical protein